MVTPTVQKTLKQYVNNLKSSITVDQLILYGSHLHGNPTKDSDIDIIVVSKDFNTMPEDDRLLLLHKAKRKIDPLLDPWGFSPNELQSASKQTTLGYARDHGIKINLSNQGMIKS